MPGTVLGSDDTEVNNTGHHSEEAYNPIEKSKINWWNASFYVTSNLQP